MKRGENENWKENIRYKHVQTQPARNSHFVLSYVCTPDRARGPRAVLIHDRASSGGSARCFGLWPIAVRVRVRVDKATREAYARTQDMVVPKKQMVMKIIVNPAPRMEPLSNRWVECRPDKSLRSSDAGSILPARPDMITSPILTDKLTRLSSGLCPQQREYFFTRPSCTPPTATPKRYV